jgi:DNA repair protein RadD
LQCLVSNGVLTTGVNVKHVDLIVLAMLTKSVNKYAQILFRGTRVIYADGFDIGTKEGRLAAIANGPKPDFMVLDFGENIERNGPIDNLNVPQEKKKGAKLGEPLVKYCPECEGDNAIAALVCSTCGYEFPGPERKVFNAPSMASVMSEPPAWINVGGVSYAIHKKAGKPDSLRVTYQCGLVGHAEWICFEHSGYARTKAESWWLKYGQAPVPKDCAEALLRKGELADIAEIQVKRNGKYTEIVGRKIKEQETCPAT